MWYNRLTARTLCTLHIAGGRIDVSTLFLRVFVQKGTDQSGIWTLRANSNFPAENSYAIKMSAWIWGDVGILHQTSARIYSYWNLSVPPLPWIILLAGKNENSSKLTSNAGPFDLPYFFLLAHAQTNTENCTYTFLCEADEPFITNNALPSASMEGEVKMRSHQNLRAQKKFCELLCGRCFTALSKSLCKRRSLVTKITIDFYIFRSGVSLFLVITCYGSTDKGESAWGTPLWMTAPEICLLADAPRQLLIEEATFQTPVLLPPTTREYVSPLELAHRDSK